MSEFCPTCGSPVRVVSGREGTAHYEPEGEPWLRLADAHALLLSVPHDEDGVPAMDDFAGLFSALDYALRGDSGCIEPDEWQRSRENALAEHAEYLSAPVHREEGKRDG